METKVDLYELFGEDIFRIIMQYLTFDDSLEIVCRYPKIVSDTILWTILLKRDFNIDQVCDYHYYYNYRYEYLKQQRLYENDSEEEFRVTCWNYGWSNNYSDDESY